MLGSPPPEPLRVRPTRLGIASLACCALGTWLRIDYALVHHHLRHRASSDALQYLERAQDLLHRGAVPGLPAALWPPGASALWAALSAVDPSQQLSAAWNAGASLLVMPLTAAIAGLLAGTRAAWIALAIAALHPGFIHYSGFALAEQPLQLAVAVALYLTLSALVRLEAEPVPRQAAALRTVARAASTAPAAASLASAPSTRAGTLHSAASGLGGAVASAAIEETGGASREIDASYITAEVVSKAESQRPPGGKLAPPTPGGGSAQGKWFGRFRAPPSEPPAGQDFSAARRGFIGRGDRDPGAGANRSPFADRGRRGVFGRGGDRAAVGESAQAHARPARTDTASLRANEIAKRGGELPFRTGANREAGASSGADLRRPRAAWTSGLDPSRPAGELLKMGLPATRDASALKAELTAEAAADGSPSRAGAADSGARQAPPSLHRAGAVASDSLGGDTSRQEASAEPGSTGAQGNTETHRGPRRNERALGPAGATAPARDFEDRSEQAAAGSSAAPAGASASGPTQSDLPSGGAEAEARDGTVHRDSGQSGAALAAAVSSSAQSEQAEPRAAQVAAGSGEPSNVGGEPRGDFRSDATGVPAGRTAPHALAGTANLCVAGAAVGCAWGLAALFRPDALAVASLGALALLVASRSVAPPRAVWAALGAAAGAILVVTAAAHRCTATANDHVCLVSSDIALNVALGQAGPVSGLEFRDPNHPELATTWIAPALTQHGYQGVGHVPASASDAAGVWRWIGARLVADPVAYAVRAAGNALDLFNLSSWPSEFGRFSERTALVWRQAWSAAVFVPALFACFALARRAFGTTRIRPVAIFVLGALLGLTLAAAFSAGESRYRIPFDGLWIGLASAAYARADGWYAVDFVPAESLAARHCLVWSNALVLCVVAVIALTHPGLNLGLVLPHRGPALPNRGRQDWAAAAAVAPGAGASAYVWQCRPDCGEFRVRFGSRRRERRVSLSLDANDRYRLLFYRSGQLRAYVDVPPALAMGLQTTTVEVPAPARSGFDTIGVQPLYGDGSYTLGHLRLD